MSGNYGAEVTIEFDVDETADRRDAERLLEGIADHIATALRNLPGTATDPEITHANITDGGPTDDI